jgi:hypothetical protein
MAALAEGTCSVPAATSSHPPFTSSGRPVTPDLSHYRPKRVRRASSVGPGMGLGGDVHDMSHHDRPGARVVKFRLSGEHRSGVSLNEAMRPEALSSKRLSKSRAFMLRDIAQGMYSKMTVKVRVRCLPPAVPLIVVCT